MANHTHSAKAWATVLLAALAVPGCDRGSSHELIGDLGLFPEPYYIEGGLIDWDRVIAEIGIDSIALEEGVMGVGRRYSLTRAGTGGPDGLGMARWVGENSSVLPAEHDSPFPPLDFIRLADFIRAEGLEDLADPEPPRMVDGTYYRLQAWERGRSEPLVWWGTEYTGGDQRVWMLRWAVAGMALRIRWQFLPVW